MKRIILILVLLGFLLPGSANADLANLLNSNGLNDSSYAYLQDIFGVVDGVLHGTGTQIMGQMFGAFNSAVLTLGFIIMSYVFFVSTINTAHEGEMLGKKWSSIWIPLRVVSSTALIVPKSTGYCAIQVIVMSVVVSGVLAADKVMMAALNYLGNGGQLIQASPPPTSDQVLIAGNVLKSLTCMNGVYNLVLNDSIANGQPRPLQFVPSDPQLNGNSYFIYFPSADANYAYNNTNYAGFCGNVTWTAALQTTNNLSDETPTTTQDVRGVAVQQMIMDLQPYAESLANSLVPVNNSAGAASQPVATQTVQQIISANTISVVLAAADYKGIMLPIETANSNSAQMLNQATITNTAKQGWLMLGSLYFNIAQMNHNTDGNDSNLPTANLAFDKSSPAYQYVKNLPGYSSLNCDYNNSAINCNNSLTNISASSISSSNNLIDNNILFSKTNLNANGLYSNNPTSATSQSFNTTGDASEIIKAIMGPIIGPLWAIVDNMQALFNAEKQNTDPIIAISGLGSGLVGLVSTLWFGIGAAVFGFTVSASFMPSVNPVGFGVLAFLSWFVPTFSALLIGLFVAGAGMAFYVPMIPFILFTFAALGWFAAVFESMIAAPLVALGIAYPENHEIFGKAEPAIMLLTNVFLRPTLMVFGFFGGAILSHVGLWILNKGFATAWGLGTTGAATMNLTSLGVFGMIWVLIAALIIYMSLVLAIINQTFGLIHQLPDELLRWLGGGMKALGSSPSEALSSVKGNMDSASHSMGSGLQKNAEKGMEKLGGQGNSGNTKGQGGMEDTTGGGNTELAAKGGQAALGVPPV